ncbi:hypothetical protein [Modestobacter sp. VKM Ac-2984]|uniref:hypothetical protein n=1 Tax=Modestobacter sp. VKM Ac-2984 TaxID=3004138 RepID=UPI0022AB4B23|nr:hypothetical protein [Modestobacter sp. VKM Ac-2984]MCZ2816192.1 hypothetical protein [Modestobacter sp. VKM Ac-2984]
MTSLPPAPALRGINYDVGTDYASVPSRISWHRDDVTRDLLAIRDELHCTTVNLFGTDTGRLAEAAGIARRVGLDVWVQPRLIDRPQHEVLAHLLDAARAVEQLRLEHGAVVLNVGCEWSVFSDGVIPGRSYAERAAHLGRPWSWPALPLYSRRLNRLLAQAVEVARAEFHGPVTYAAGLWEQVDWRPFDLVGLNYYRLRWNRLGYAGRLRKHVQHGRPVVITEFGCATFRGAAALGPAGHTIVRYGPEGPSLAPGYVRDEQEQADYLHSLLDVYRAAGVAGTFVFEFAEPYKPHSADPRADLDMSGYGIVKVLPGSPGGPLDWEPKAAFRTLARAYEAA